MSDKVFIVHGRGNGRSLAKDIIKEIFRKAEIEEFIKESKEKGFWIGLEKLKGETHYCIIKENGIIGVTIKDAATNEIIINALENGMDELDRYINKRNKRKEV